MFDGIKQEMKQDPEYLQNRELLFNKLLGERVVNQNPQILSALEKDPNQNLYTLITDYINGSEGSKVGLEDMKTYINANIHDRDGQIASVIGIGTDPNDKTVECVSPKTYDELKGYVTDYEKLGIDINLQLDRNAI